MEHQLPPPSFAIDFPSSLPAYTLCDAPAGFGVAQPCRHKFSQACQCFFRAAAEQYTRKAGDKHASAQLSCGVFFFFFCWTASAKGMLEELAGAPVPALATTPLVFLFFFG
jgi:hypothetical protein